MIKKISLIFLFLTLNLTISLTFVFLNSKKNAKDTMIDTKGIKLNVIQSNVMEHLAMIVDLTFALIK